MDQQGNIRLTRIQDSRMYSMGHYVVKSADMDAILEEIEADNDWHLIYAEEPITEAAKIDEEIRLSFSFYRLNDEKYIMEGVTYSESAEKCLKHLPEKIKTILSTKKPIKYSNIFWGEGK